MKRTIVSNWSTGDLVPVTERLRNLQLWRTAVLPLAALAVLVVPNLSMVPAAGAALAVVMFVAVGAVLTWASGRERRFIRTLARVLPLGDAVAVVGMSLAVGGPQSPLRYLLVLQAVEITLLASFRTGLKLVAWQSLVVSSLYVIGPAVWPRLVTVSLSARGRLELQVLVGCAWIAAIMTAWMAAANERELRRRRYDLEQLADYHSALEASEESTTAAAAFVSKAHDELDTGRIVIAVADGADGLTVLATMGLESAPTRLDITPGSLVAEVLEATKTLLVSGLDPLLDAQLCGVFGQTNLAGLSLRTAQGPGLILVEPQQKRGSRVERRVVSMLERYRDDLASKLSNLWLIDSLRIAATTDPLTGVANRGRLRELLRAGTQQSIRTQMPLCVTILDVDHFKRVNDTHGHAAGDQVLRQVASVLEYNVRPYDTVARYGGEEFVVLLPGVDLDEAALVLERLRAAIPTGTSPVAVTASFGLARFDPSVDDADNVVKRADAMLYEAKQNGRNRVMIARQTPFVAGAPATDVEP